MEKSVISKPLPSFFLAMISCLLWGSAVPCVKIGYKLFGIGQNEPFSQILFGGIRFFFAGIFTIIIGSVLKKKFLKPQKSEMLKIFKLSVFQTFLQYTFFNIGLSNTGGTKVSILNSTNVFMTILFSALIFRQEKLTKEKIIGCIFGFAGAVIINFGDGLNLAFNFKGDGLILLAAASYAVSSVLTKEYSKGSDPVMLCGYQFVLGGLLMILVGTVFGGRLIAGGSKAVIMMTYLSVLSAVAFSLWGLLLKYNSVAKISVFGFMNPVFGVILSTIILNEHGLISPMRITVSLIMVGIGMYITACMGNQKSKKE